MRVGIDFLFAQKGTTQGYDACLRNLLLGLEKNCTKDKIFVFCNSSYFLENRNLFNNLELIDCKVNGNNRFQRVVYEFVSLPNLIKKYNIQGMYFPTHFRPFVNLGDIWSVFNIYDLQYRYLPNNFGFIQKLVRDFFYRLSLDKSDRTICLSKYVQSTVLEQFPSFDHERLVVIPVPILFDDLQKDTADKMDQKSPPFILSIGKHFPHKNFETLIRAFSILHHRKQFQGKLVIAGSFTKHTKFLQSLVYKLNLSEYVHFTGYIDDATREKLYRSAQVFVFPSLYEGFGMPVIEAMGRQLPVVCSDTTALPEVTLGLANYYSPATSEAALAQEINNVLTHPPTQAHLHLISAKVRNLYSIENISRQYLSLWESLS